MKEKFIELLDKYANVSDELLQVENDIEKVKNELGESQAMLILIEWLNTEVGNA